MEGFHILRLFVTILLVSLAGISTADTIPAEVAFIQGSHYEMTNGTNGMSELTITGIIPYFYILNSDSNRLIPVQNLSNIITPVNAALMVSDTGNETVTLVSISNLTLSGDAKTMILQVKPLEFYEGSALEMFTSRMSNEGLQAGEIDGLVGLYLELSGFPPENVLLPGPKPRVTDPPISVT